MCAHACTPDCRKRRKKQAKVKKGREKRVKVSGMNAHRSCESYPRLKITCIYLLLHCKPPHVLFVFARGHRRTRKASNVCFSQEQRTNVSTQATLTLPFCTLFSCFSFLRCCENGHYNLLMANHYPLKILFIKDLHLE